MRKLTVKLLRPRTVDYHYRT